MTHTTLVKEWINATMEKLQVDNMCLQEVELVASHVATTTIMTMLISVSPLPKPTLKSPKH